MNIHAESVHIKPPAPPYDSSPMDSPFDSEDAPVDQHSSQSRQKRSFPKRYALTPMSDQEANWLTAYEEFKKQNLDDLMRHYVSADGDLLFAEPTDLDDETDVRYRYDFEANFEDRDGTMHRATTAAQEAALREVISEKIIARGEKRQEIATERAAKETEVTDQMRLFLTRDFITRGIESASAKLFFRQLGINGVADLLERTKVNPEDLQDICQDGVTGAQLLDLTEALREERIIRLATQKEERTEKVRSIVKKIAASTLIGGGVAAVVAGTGGLAILPAALSGVASGLAGLLGKETGQRLGKLISHDRAMKKVVDRKTGQTEGERIASEVLSRIVKVQTEAAAAWKNTMDSGLEAGENAAISSVEKMSGENLLSVITNNFNKEAKDLLKEKVTEVDEDGKVEVVSEGGVLNDLHTSEKKGKTTGNIVGGVLGVGLALGASAGVHKMLEQGNYLAELAKIKAQMAHGGVQLDLDHDGVSHVVKSFSHNGQEQFNYVLQHDNFFNPHTHQLVQGGTINADIIDSNSLKPGGLFNIDLFDTLHKSGVQAVAHAPLSSTEVLSALSEMAKDQVTSIWVNAALSGAVPAAAALATIMGYEQVKQRQRFMLRGSRAEGSSVAEARKAVAGLASSAFQDRKPYLHNKLNAEIHPSPEEKQKAASADRVKAFEERFAGDGEAQLDIYKNFGARWEPLVSGEKTELLDTRGCVNVFNVAPLSDGALLAQKIGNAIAQQHQDNAARPSSNMVFLNGGNELLLTMLKADNQFLVQAREAQGLAPNAELNDDQIVMAFKKLVVQESGLPQDQPGNNQIVFLDSGVKVGENTLPDAEGVAGYISDSLLAKGLTDVSDRVRRYKSTIA